MPHLYSPVEMAEIFEQFIRAGDSYSLFVTAWRRIHGRSCHVPDDHTVRDIAKRFRETGSTAHRSYSPSVLSPDKLREIEEIITQNRHLSLRMVAQQAGVSKTTAWKAISVHLKMKPYRITRIHELKPPDYAARLEFCQWIQVRGSFFSNLANSFIMHSFCILQTFQNNKVCFAGQNGGRRRFPRPFLAE